MVQAYRIAHSTVRGRDISLVGMFGENGEEKANTNSAVARNGPLVATRLGRKAA